MCQLVDTKQLSQYSFDWRQLQGCWRMTSMRLGDELVPSQIVGNSTVVVDGDVWELEFRNRFTAYDFRLDPSRNHLDLISDVGGIRKVIRCLYEWDGDRLVICRPFRNTSRRPERIESAEGVGVSVWERQPETKPITRPVEAIQYDSVNNSQSEVASPA
ncbi:MAG: TIGR03067 domain-containing protein [Gemmataceae bacterium]